jgi:S-adenosylmethionine hydrolase
VVLKTAGTQTLTATSGLFKGTGTVTVNPGAVNSLVLGSIPTTATAGQGFAVTVTAKDQFGNVCTNFNGSATVSASLAGSLTSPTTGTFSNGVLTLNAVTLTKAGSQTLSVAVGTLKVTTNAITVNAGALAKFAISAPSSVAVGASFNASVTAEDAFGNVLTNYVGTVTLTSSDPLAGGLGTFTFATSNRGVLNLSGLVLKTAGNQTLTASNGATPPVTGSVSITV